MPMRSKRFAKSSRCNGRCPLVQMPQVPMNAWKIPVIGIRTSGETTKRSRAAAPRFMLSRLPWPQDLPPIAESRSQSRCQPALLVRFKRSAAGASSTSEKVCAAPAHGPAIPDRAESRTGRAASRCKVHSASRRLIARSSGCVRLIQHPGLQIPPSR